MTGRAALLIGACTAVAALVAGCAQAAPGSATPAPDVASAVQRPQLSPPVPHPHDVRAYGDRPCDVFTVEQLTAFGFDRPPDSTDTLPSGNKTCVWIDTAYTGRLSVITYPDWDILERVYLNQGTVGVFQPLQVAGFPAVAHQSAPGMPGCYVTVGLAARQGIEVTFTDLREPPDDPCGAARIGAEVAVGNLPPLK